LAKLLCPEAPPEAVQDLELAFDSVEFRPGAEIVGRVSVGFPGRYDGVVINAQVLDSNGLITFRGYNGRGMSRSAARLFVGRDAMPGGTVEFAAAFEFEPEGELEVKFRASIIEQHKEIESAVVFGRLLAP